MKYNKFNNNDNVIPHQVRNDGLSNLRHCGLDPQSHNRNNYDKLYYVGGVVRDELLGIQSLDVDLVYEGNAIEFAAALPFTHHSSPKKQPPHPPAYSRHRRGVHPLPQGARESSIELLQTNEPFGTVRVKLNGCEVDIASTREEVYERKGHLPTVTKIGCPLQDDVKRRDFTINSLYKSVTTGEIIDFTGGLDDLKNKTIRVLHDKSFIDDPTRILRALKFAVRFGFALNPHTKKLQDEYLKNINYDMCYKRIKKELIETFNLNSQTAFETFINDGIYKLVTTRDVTLPLVNIEKLVTKYFPPHPTSEPSHARLNNIWLVYVGVIGDLSRLPLTRTEQKILDDFNAIDELKSNFEIYKAFEKVLPETVLLYAILKDETAARKYFEKLQHIKLSITGKDLQEIGITPSPEYQKIFDYVLKAKLANPEMTKSEELNAAKNYLIG